MFLTFIRASSGWCVRSEPFIAGVSALSRYIWSSASLTRARGDSLPVKVEDSATQASWQRDLRLVGHLDAGGEPSHFVDQRFRLFFGEAGEYDNELIAAEACVGRRFDHHIAQGIRHRAENVVPGIVADEVVE